MRLGKNKEVKASAYDKDGKLITSIYDSGFERISEVLQALRCKACNPKRFDEVGITVDDEEYHRYKVCNDTLKKIF